MLRGVAGEARPPLGTGDDPLQGGEHLTAVANAQGEGVRAGEKGLKMRSQGVREKDRPGPAFACTENVAVGEATAGDKTGETREIDPARHDIAQVDVDGGKASGVEGCRGLGVAVYSLLAKYRYERARPCQARRALGEEPERGLLGNTGIVVVEERPVLLLGALGVVSKPLHLKARLRPLALELNPRAAIARVTGRDRDRPGARRAADDRHVFPERLLQDRQHPGGVELAHLEDHPRLLVEELLEATSTKCPEIDLEPAPGGKGHLEQRHDQATVGAVVVGAE